MKKQFAILSILVALILVISCSSVEKTAFTRSNRIKIASFNIQIFGNSKASRNNVMTVLAKIATRYDIMAIQEVGSNGNPSETTTTAVMNKYLSKINESAGERKYSYVCRSQYAFIYCNNTITLNRSDLYHGTLHLTYQPLIGNFSVKEGNFKFSIINIHTSPEKANTEIPSLRNVMEDVRNYYHEQDVICLGDYNADGNYYTSGSADQRWLNGFPNDTYITVIINGSDTNVDPSTNYTYDRMQLFRDTTGEDYTGKMGVLRFSSYYKIDDLEGTDSTRGTERALSDHYPIWAEFYTDRDTD